MKAFLIDLLKNLVRLSLRIITGYTTLALCLFGTVLIIGVIALIANPELADDSSISDQQHVFGDESSPNKLLSLRIDGEIDGQAPDDDAERYSGIVYGYELKQALYDAADNSSIKGIVLEINSPGGTIYGAQAVADGVKYFRDKTHQPVYAHVSGLAASGAYWAAASSDRIIADLGSSIGSIGVIDGPYKYYDKVLSETDDESSVVTQNGIQSINITAGKGKDEGDPYQKLTAEEVANLQLSVNNDYAEFVKYVSERRHIAADVIRNHLGAYIYGTQTATAEKLIDATGGREDAYAALAKAAQLKSDDYEVVRPQSTDDSVSGATLLDQARTLLAGRKAVTKLKAAATQRPCDFTGIRALYGDPAARCAK